MTGVPSKFANFWYPTKIEKNVYINIKDMCKVEIIKDNIFNYVTKFLCRLPSAEVALINQASYIGKPKTGDVVGGHGSAATTMTN